MELPDPPEGWSLKSLIEINEHTWHAQLWALEAYVYGYGSSARYAMLDAIKRVEDCNYYNRLSGMKKWTEPASVRKSIDDIIATLSKAPQEPMKRRF